MKEVKGFQLRESKEIGIGPAREPILFVLGKYYCTGCEKELQEEELENHECLSE